MDEKYIVAVEIGSSKIKGAIAVAQNGAPLNVIAVHEEPLIDSVRYGQIKNVEEVSNRIDRIRRKLESATAVAPNKIKGVYVGVSGLTVGSSSIDSSLDFDGETEITAATIDDLKNRALQSMFSDKDTYDIIPRGFYVDNMETANPVGTFGSSIRGSFVIISGAPGLMSNIKRVFPERLQLDINGTIVSPIAQAETVLTDDERRLGALFVDLGAETTTVAIYKGGSLQYLATLPMGSRNITRDLVALNYLEERAEDIKRTYGVSATADDTPRIAAPDGLQLPEINNYISARASEIIANVLAQIEFAGFKPSELPAGIIMVGGGSRMKGFSDMLASQSRMNVRTGSAPREIRISDTSIVADDSIDVISLLLNAAQLGQRLADCIEQPAPQRDTRDWDNTRQTTLDDQFYGSGYADDDDYDSRVGRSDDDDILADDPDDDTPRKRGGKSGSRETGRHIEKEKPSGPSFMSKLKDRLANLVSDKMPDSDRFDEDDSDDDE